MKRAREPGNGHFLPGTTASKEDIETILYRLAEGESLREACKGTGTTHWSILRLVVDDENFGKQYARARAAGSELDSDEIVEIADTECKDQVAVQWAKNRIEARKWRASKQTPKFRDKQDVAHAGGITLQVVTGVPAGPMIESRSVAAAAQVTAPTRTITFEERPQVASPSSPVPSKAGQDAMDGA